MTPQKITSGCWLLWYREDLPRTVADVYWDEPHGDIVAELPHITEYLQHHLCDTDHGYWPATAGTGTRIPPSWRIDGMPEVRLNSMPAAVLTAPHMGRLFLDEQRVFDRVLAHLSGPGRARWWSGPYGQATAHRTVLLLRRRRGLRPGQFSDFIHASLGPALMAGGARELRTHAFLPWTKMMHPTPGVAHDNPIHRRYHGAVVIGADSREHMDEIIASDSLERVIASQGEYVVAVHAYTVARTVPLVLNRSIVQRSPRSPSSSAP